MNVSTIHFEDPTGNPVRRMFIDWVSGGVIHRIISEVHGNEVSNQEATSKLMSQFESERAEFPEDPT
jgi:hypothetical protein